MRTALVIVTLFVGAVSGFISNSALIPPASPLSSPSPPRSRSFGGIVWLARSTSTRNKASLSDVETVDDANAPVAVAVASAAAVDTAAAAPPSSSSSLPSSWKSQILEALSTIMDPDLDSDIVTLGFVQNLRVDDSSVVSLDLELTTPARPVKELFVQQCTDAINSLGWTRGAAVALTARPAEDPAPGAPMGMSQVGAVIAVSSCKGGVGKSTTAVNLAYSLRNLGASVGIFDADVYGPSLPTMVTPEDDDVRFVGRQIAPLRRDGVSLMSFGYVNEGSAVMRGPMVTQLLDQFLSLTNWGPIDYLILDMPPGTGDIQLTLSQRLNITAAVIVTTPQELSFVDVERGVEMFDTVNVPCVAVVENMAYLEREREKATVQLDEPKLRENFMDALRKDGLLDDGNANANAAADVVDELVEIVRQNLQSNDAASGETEQIRIFGPGHKRRLSEQWGIEHTFSMPLMSKIARNGDSGTPFVLDEPDSPQAEIYKELAKSVVKEVAKAKFGKGRGGRPTATYDAEAHTILIGGDGGDGGAIAPAELRRECRCAACVEELTGKRILNPQSVPESVRPIAMSPTGNYALSVDWSDGHKSLYPYRQIRSMLAGPVSGGRDAMI